MSEKLDGVRAIWDGHKFISRNEKDFESPEWFKAGIPDILLDGELWQGRGRFNECSGQVRRKTNQDWSEIMFMILDLPELSNRGSTWSLRQEYLRRTLIDLPDHVKIHRQILCNGNEHLLEFEQEVLANGGEGVMLAHPDGHYLNKRTDKILKVKRFNDDDAIVLRYEGGKGKHEGRVGALVCAYQGNVIYIGTGLNDYERENPPEIGSVITFKYFEMSEDNIPRFPVFIGVRADESEGS
jgi:DNA ligase-1